MSDFVSVLKLYSKETCFQCKPNLPSGKGRSTWSNFLLSYVNPHTNILFYINNTLSNISLLKNILFFIFFIKFFSLQVRHVLPRTLIFGHFVWKRLLSEMFWQIYMKLEVKYWKKTQATVRTHLKYISNLFGLFLNDLDNVMKPPCHSIVCDMDD